MTPGKQYIVKGMIYYFHSASISSMGALETFLKGDQGMEGLFHPPVCRRLEENFDRVFSYGKLNQSGQYLVHDAYIVAEARVAVVRGLIQWDPNDMYEGTGIVLVKNPQNNRLVEETLGYGAKNTILLSGDSGIVFAGRVTEDYVTVLRPVVTSYQDIFREELHLLGKAMPSHTFCLAS